jgi:protein phosphatase
MSPPETTREPGLLEHPAEAFAYYAKNGVSKVICEEKHMGSRAVIVLCRDEVVAKDRFGIEGDGIGIIYTRTGRRFFNDPVLEQAVLRRLTRAIDADDLWTTYKTGWFCIDCEIMPWSVKAQELIFKQYAAVGASANSSLTSAISALTQAQASGVDVDVLVKRYSAKAQNIRRYVDAYRRYCWPVKGVGDLKIAPFHLLASEGKVHSDLRHAEHMSVFHQLARHDPGWLVATSFVEVDLDDEKETTTAITWWTALTGGGGEGMVVKPVDFIARGKRGLLQPAIKCRGAEYLRIIYGPEYSTEENLERLRARGLATKRSMALREFALGMEGLDRFVHREPLRRTHECVFGVLAMESEPVDPRL